MNILVTLKSEERKLEEQLDASEFRFPQPTERESDLLERLQDLGLFRRQAPIRNAIPGIAPELDPQFDLRRDHDQAASPLTEGNPMVRNDRIRLSEKVSANKRCTMLFFAFRTRFLLAISTASFVVCSTSAFAQYAQTDATSQPLAREQLLAS